MLYRALTNHELAALARDTEEPSNTLINELIYRLEVLGELGDADMVVRRSRYGEQAR